MKQAVMLFLAIFLFSCERDVEPEKTGTFVLAFDGGKEISSGKVSADDMPAFVRLTMVSTTGKLIYNNEKIPLVHFPNGFSINPLVLPVGTYSVTGLIVTNANDLAIYATPIAGAAFADRVEKPLPIEIVVTENGVTNQSFEVVKITGDAQQFGYAVFSFQVIKRLLSKDVFQYVDSVGDYVSLYKSLYTFAGKRLVEINDVEVDKNGKYYPGRKQMFSYDSSGRLVTIKDQWYSYLDFFHVKDFTYKPGTVEINYYELHGTTKSPGWITQRIATPTGIALVDEYRKVDFKIVNGNIAEEKLSDKPFPWTIEYDNHINPEYFPDVISELSYINFEMGSKNNFVKKTTNENGVLKVIGTVSVTYDSDGYPLTKLLAYTQGAKFKYVYSYE